MTKIITTTFLLKNPSKVREMVSQGIDLLVKYEGKITMQISIPKKTTNQVLPPVYNLRNKKLKKETYRREDIYNGKYD